MTPNYSHARTSSGGCREWTLVVITAHTDFKELPESRTSDGKFHGHTEPVDQIPMVLSCIQYLSGYNSLGHATGMLINEGQFLPRNLERPSLRKYTKHPKSTIEILKWTHLPYTIRVLGITAAAPVSFQAQVSFAKISMTFLYSHLMENFVWQVPGCDTNQRP